LRGNACSSTRSFLRVYQVGDVQGHCGNPDIQLPRIADETRPGFRLAVAARGLATIRLSRASSGSSTGFRAGSIDRSSSSTLRICPAGMPVVTAGPEDAAASRVRSRLRARCKRT
jgi:hypothetical protein